ncbi:hypothetical protein Tco_1208723 [Tanacetum coccineum]
MSGCDDGDDVDDAKMMITMRGGGVGASVVMERARGGEWYSGSYRSDDEEKIWDLAGKVAGKVSGGRRRWSSGGRKIWCLSGLRRLYYLLDKVVQAGTALGPNDSNHNNNIPNNGDGVQRVRTFRETIFPE